MKLKIIATGSDGNCALLSSETTNILIDLGFATNKKMEEILIPEIEGLKIDAVLITHGHGDHMTNWSGRFCMDRDIPVFLHEEHFSDKKLVHEDKRAKITREAKTIFIEDDFEFKVGDINFSAFKTPHSALGQQKGHFSLGYIFREEGTFGKFCFLSDVGYISNRVKRKLKNVETIALEFNYYTDMMIDSERNHKDKLRNIGRFGHLSNEEALGLVKWLKGNKLNKVITLHPSNSHNDLERLRKDLEKLEIDFVISKRDEKNETIELKGGDGNVFC